FLQEEGGIGDGSVTGVQTCALPICRGRRAARTHRFATRRMSVAEVKVPRLAESISEATLVQWLKQDGDTVRVDEPIATLETDKEIGRASCRERGGISRGDGSVRTER